MEYSIIQRSALEGALRLDAEYYRPEFLRIASSIKSVPHVTLGDQAFVTDGEHGSVEFFENGVKYLTAENVQEGSLELSNIRFVSEVVDRRNKRASLVAGDVVLSIKGTVGQAALINEEDLPANMNRDVARIHPNKIDPYFLVAFLNSKIGRDQVFRESSGNVQQMITLERVRAIAVPTLSTKDVQQVIDPVKQSQVLLRQSRQLYREAEQLLLKTLGLDDLTKSIDGPAIATVMLSQLREADRLDAEYFRPKYKRLFDHLRRHSATVLGDLVTIKRGIEPGSEAYVKEGKPFIRVSNVTKLGISELIDIPCWRHNHTLPWETACFYG